MQAPELFGAIETPIFKAAVRPVGAACPSERRVEIEELSRERTCEGRRRDVDEEALLPFPPPNRL